MVFSRSRMSKSPPSPSSSLSAAYFNRRRTKFIRGRAERLGVCSPIECEKEETTSTPPMPSCFVEVKEENTQVSPCDTVSVPDPTVTARLPHPSIRRTSQQGLPIRQGIQLFDERNDERGNEGRVTFASKASIVEIPHHESYSRQSRHAQWASSHETRQMAWRNAMEVRSEGGPANWRNFKEDDQLVEYPPGSDNYIHPYSYWMVTGLAPYGKSRRFMEETKRLMEEKKQKKLSYKIQKVVRSVLFLRRRCRVVACE